MKKYIVTYHNESNIPIIYKLEAKSLEEAITKAKELVGDKLKFISCSLYDTSINLFKLKYSTLGE